MAITPFWRAHGRRRDFARTGRATNRDRRRAAAEESRERNDNRPAASRDGAPPPALGRARGRFRRRPAPGSAAGAIRAARPDLPRRTRIDPSGRAQGSQGDRRRLPARRSARDVEGRWRRRRFILAPRSLRSRVSSRRTSALRRRNSGCMRAIPRVISRSADAISPSARSRALPIRMTAPAGGGPAISATTRTSSASGRVSIRFTSGAAIRSSRSTFMRPCAISTRCSTC